MRVSDSDGGRNLKPAGPSLEVESRTFESRANLKKTRTSLRQHGNRAGPGREPESRPRCKSATEPEPQSLGVPPCRPAARRARRPRCRDHHDSMITVTADGSLACSWSVVTTCDLHCQLTLKPYSTNDPDGHTVTPRPPVARPTGNAA